MVVGQLREVARLGNYTLPFNFSQMRLSVHSFFRESRDAQTVLT